MPDHPFVCPLHEDSFARVELALEGMRTDLAKANEKLDNLLGIEGPISKITGRMVAVESSCVQAHKRLDGFERALKTTSNRVVDVMVRVASLAGTIGLLIVLLEKHLK